MKIKKSILISLILIWHISGFSSLDGQLKQKKFLEYTIDISQNFESGLGKLTIKNKNQKIFEESDVDNHYYFGNNFDEESKNKLNIENITGNSIPNMIISNWTGGAHCCHFLSVFELGKKFKKIITVEANSSQIRLIDLDHDGFPEIEFYDGAIDYVFASFAGSPGGRIVLKFQKDQYKLAPILMKKPLPSMETMEIIKNKIKIAFKSEQSPGLPYEFLNTMMDLSYSGHFKFALDLASEIWPHDKPGLSRFKEEFAKSLKASLYWQNI